MLTESREGYHPQTMEAHQGLVLKIAMRFVGRGLDLDDLIQEGQIGLGIGLELYDASTGIKAVTYLTQWVRQRIERAIAQQAFGIAIPYNGVQLVYRYRKCYWQLASKLGRKPYFEEVIDGMKLKKKLNRKCLDDALAALDDRTDSHGEIWGHAINWLGAEDAANERWSDTEDRRQLVNRLVSVLKPNELEVIFKHYGLDGEGGKDNRAIGREKGVGRQRIADLKREAITKMKEYAEKQGYDAA
jgi:RNA polymerase primary sigma factor